jgi:hypothetical protein
MALSKEEILEALKSAGVTDLDTLAERAAEESEKQGDVNTSLQCIATSSYFVCA